jgi:hypothetical protein
MAKMLESKTTKTPNPISLSLSLSLLYQRTFVLCSYHRREEIAHHTVLGESEVTLNWGEII